jgi:hypothetical protein
VHRLRQVLQFKVLIGKSGILRETTGRYFHPVKNKQIVFGPSGCLALMELSRPSVVVGIAHYVGHSFVNRRVIDLHCTAENPRVSVRRSTAPRTTDSSLGLLYSANINKRPPRCTDLAPDHYLLSVGEKFSCVTWAAFLAKS